MAHYTYKPPIKVTRQYRPDLTERFSPRIPSRLRTAVNRICRANGMPEADVLRYGFEAAVLLAYRRKLRLARPVGAQVLDDMMTVRTSRSIARMVREIHGRLLRKDGTPLQADVLRWLLATILPIAQKKGMAHLMALRERELSSSRG